MHYCNYVLYKVCRQGEPNISPRFCGECAKLAETLKQCRSNCGHNFDRFKNHLACTCDPGFIITVPGDGGRWRAMFPLNIIFPDSNRQEGQNHPLSRPLLIFRMLVPSPFIIVRIMRKARSGDVVQYVQLVNHLAINPRMLAVGI